MKAFVHVAYDARGSEAFKAALLAAADVWHASSSKERLRFHLLVANAELRALRKVNLSIRTQRAGLPDPHCVTTVNSSDRALMPAHAIGIANEVVRMNPMMMSLHALLPRNVPQVIMLHTDVLALDDVCTLYDHATAQFAAINNAVMAFAKEQTGIHQQAVGQGRNRVNDSVLAFNGGVGVHRLDRLRNLSTTGNMRLLLSWVQDANSSKVARSLPREASTNLVLASSSRRADKARELIVTLPCEWNWQTNLLWYTSQKRNHRVPDATCHQAPALLHATGEFKDVTRALLNREAGRYRPTSPMDPRGIRLSRTAVAAMIDSYLSTDLGLYGQQGNPLRRTPRYTCWKASSALSADARVGSRFCNTSFLLLRLRGHANRTTHTRNSSTAPQLPLPQRFQLSHTQVSTMDLFMRWIEARQNPPACPMRLTHFYRRGSGIGSQILLMANQMLEVLQRGGVFEVSNTSCAYTNPRACGDDSWGCYVQPLTRCPPNAIGDDRPSAHWTKCAFFNESFWANVAASLTSSPSKEASEARLGIEFVLAGITKYLLRPTRWRADKIP